MGQFSVEKPVAPGSVLSGNQHRELASFQFGDCHDTYWLRPVQGTTVVFAFFGKDFTADPQTHDVSIKRTRQNASANARRKASRSPSR
jgi:hypothetical protein